MMSGQECEDEELELELELTCAVASPFALMASITGLLDGYKTSMNGVNKGR